VPPPQRTIKVAGKITVVYLKIILSTYIDSVGKNVQFINLEVGDVHSYHCF
jgi:hypothetical protein